MALREVLAHFGIRVTGGRQLAGAMTAMRSAETAALTLDRGMKSLAGTMARQVLPLFAGLGAAKLFTGGIDAAATFGEAISAVGAVGLETRGQISALEQKALELGESTVFSATEAANGMELMRKAGFDTEATIAGIGGVLNAAAAEGMGLAQASDIVSNVLKGMRLEAGEATRVADVLALASARTNASISSLGQSMSNVASTAAEVGLGLEETVASVALLQDVGLDASVAGSAMNTMLTRLAKPSDAVATKLTEWGVAFKDAQGNALPLEGILANLSLASEKAGGNMDRIALIADLVGLRGQKAATNLAKLFSDDKVKALTEELRAGKGVAEAMAKLRLDNLKGDVKLLSSAWEGLNIQIFGSADGLQRRFIQRITDIVTVTTKWARETEATKTALRVLRAALPLALLKGLQVAFGALIKNYRVLVGFGRMLFRTVIPWIALGLAIDDVITFLRGGKSVIGDFIDELFGVGASKSVLKSIHGAWKGFVDFLKGNRGAVVATATAVGGIAVTVSLVSKALAIYRAVAATAAAVSTALGLASGGAAAGFIAMAAPVLALTAVVTAAIAALDQLLKLADEVGGFAGIGEGIKSFFAGDGFFAGADEEMNRQARERAAKRAPKTGATLTSTEPILTPQAAPGDFSKMVSKAQVNLPSILAAHGIGGGDAAIPTIQIPGATQSTNVQQDNRVNISIAGDATPATAAKVKEAGMSLQPTRNATLAASGA